MAVITDVNPDASKCRVESRIPKVSRSEIKLFPESGIYVRYVILAIFPEILSISIDNGRGVVVNTGNLFLINRHDDYHAMFFCYLLHQPNGRPIRNALNSLLDKTQMLFNVQPFDIFDWEIGRRSVRTLYQSAFNCTWHVCLSFAC